MSTLRRFSRRAWLLHGYLIASMILWPTASNRAAWSDSDSDTILDTWEDTVNNVTYSSADLDALGVDIDDDGAYNSEEAAYGSDPLSYDTDDDGLNDGVEIHLANEQAGKGYSLTNWDSNGDGISDHDDFYGISVGSVGAVTYPGGALPAIPNTSYSDYDGDGIKNPFDPYPTDPMNNDADADGLDDAVDPAPGDGGNYSYVNFQSWSGGALSDDDNDAILNFWDQWPLDSSNGSNDSDGDSVDNYSDPFPNDNSNYSLTNSLYWYGDVFGDADSDGTPNHADAWPYDSSNGSTPSNDDDGDGITNDLDPAPSDTDNYSSYNGSSWYTYPLEDADNDGQANFYDTYPNDTYDNLPDFDADGWMNGEDPFPKDGSNYSETNQTAWGGTLFNDDDGDGTLNWQDPFPGDSYNGDPDFDADGILNGADPFPEDGANFSTINQVSWGSSVLGDDDTDGVLNWEDSSPYTTTTTNDADGDTLDDSVDPALGDPTNHSSSNGQTWYANALNDDDTDGVVNFWDQWPSDPNNGSTGNTDRDADSISNDSDPAPDDYSNYSSYNTTSWFGNALGDADYDGTVNFYDYQPYGDSNVDTDADGYFDSIDPSPGDSTNFSYTNSQSWYGTALNDADGDGTLNFYDGSPYGDPPIDNDEDGLDEASEQSWGTSDSDPDSDDDGLTDGEEVNIYATHPANGYSISQGLGFGNLYSDWELVDPTDTDGDDIPDRIELHYGLNPNWSRDALLDRDNDGVNNITQYNAGIALDAHLSAYDADGDGMTDVFEDAYSQVLSKINKADAVLDADEDGVLNYEEQILLLSPTAPDSLQLNGLGDLEVLMLGVYYVDGTDPSDEDTSPANGIPDWADALKDAPAAPHFYHFTRSTAGDLDGDGMPDAWEHEYGRWKFSSNGLQLRLDDGDLDADADGLSNLFEYQIGTSPLAGDSDGDEISDDDEDFDSDGLTNAQEMTLGTNALLYDSDGDGVSDGQELTEGTDPTSAASNSTVITGLRVFTPLGSL